MKKLIIGLTALMCFSFYAENVQGRIIVNAIKSGGFLGLYNYVRQDLLDKQGGTFYYDLFCINPGWTRCRMVRGSLNQENQDLFDIALPHVEALHSEIDGDVRNGVLVGSKSIKVIYNEPNSSVKKWITVNIDYEALDENFNDGNLTITIDELPFTL